jgi:16S rRNA (cytidine1402-2'-O)-methyltransferase
LPTDSFLYLGYLPHKKNERKKSLEQISEQPYTLIFLESPHRLLDSLADIQETLGNRQICIAREMTKLYEEYFRGSISDAITYFKSKDPRGEFTLVIEGKKKEERVAWTEEELTKAIKNELKKDKSAKEISVELAETSGWNKKEIYNLVNQSK